MADANGRHYRIEACEGTGRYRTRAAHGLVPRRVIPTGAEVQVHPAALPLDLVVILSPAQWRFSDQRRCVEDDVRDAAQDDREEVLGPAFVVIESMLDQKEAA
jgi:hypothetical protein